MEHPYIRTKGWTEKHILQIVKECPKKIFQTIQMEDESIKIRCVQGHTEPSINPGKIVTKFRQDDPELFERFRYGVHFGQRANLTNILEKGLLCGGTEQNYTYDHA